MKQMIEIPVKVVPKARPKVTRRGVFMPDKYIKCRDFIRDYARAKRMKHHGTGSLGVIIFINMKPSKSERRNDYRQPIGDVDNMAGTVFDSLEGVCYENDRQIISLSVIKSYSDKDSVEVTIWDM